MNMRITLYYIKIKYLFSEVCATATNTFDLQNWVSVIYYKIRPIYFHIDRPNGPMKKSEFWNCCWNWNK